MKVSVVIPVYKVAAFVEKCVRFLMEQTLDEVEFIFVDDASPDESMDIVSSVISEYPSRTCAILRHEVNKGLPAARNTGLAAATGDYVYHCDSDDWLEPDALEKLYTAAVAADADFVYSDFFLTFASNERLMRNPVYATADEALRRGLLGGAMKYNVWNKLVRRSVYADNGITFPSGHAMGEDMTMIQCLSMSRSVAYVPVPLYHYVKLNASAYSNTMSERHLADIRFNVDRTQDFIRRHFADTFEKELGFFKLSIKLPFLITDDKSMYRLWEEWYPEADRYVMSNKDLPLRTRLLQWFAARRMWLAVAAYYKVLYKFVYGIVYK